jgi:DNA helicase-2/ATP-dependent DNA helicase PcrA
MGRHVGCPATYDERTLALLKEWRKQEATAQSLPAYIIFTDATLVALAEARPANSTELLKISGLGSAKALKYGEHVLAILRASGGGSTGDAAQLGMPALDRDAGNL